MHHGKVFLDRMFGDVLNEVSKFLDNNNAEFVFLSLREEYESETFNKSNCEVLNNYVKNFKHNVFYGWKKDDTIEKFRGGIILFDKSGFAGCIPISEGSCAKQGYYDLNDNYALYYKWEKVRVSWY